MASGSGAGDSDKAPLCGIESNTHTHTHAFLRDPPQAAPRQIPAGMWAQTHPSATAVFRQLLDRGGGGVPFRNTSLQPRRFTRPGASVPDTK